MIDKRDIIDRAWKSYKLCNKKNEFSWKSFMFHLRDEIRYAKKLDAMHHDMSVEEIKKQEIKEEECIRYMDNIDRKTHTFYSLCKLHYKMRYFVGSKWFACEFRRAYSGVMKRVNN